MKAIRAWDNNNIINDINNNDINNNINNDNNKNNNNNLDGKSDGIFIVRGQHEGNSGGEQQQQRLLP